MSTPLTRDYVRLANLAKARRLALGMSIVAVAEAAGVSKDTYRRIEESEPVREVTYAKVDPVLKWAAGSCEAILSGDAGPIALEGGGTPGTVIAQIPLEDLHQAMTSAVVAVSDSLTGAQIRELVHRTTEELMRRGLI